jgi:hypothetical protein
MGTQGAQMLARPPSAKVLMNDLADWWKDISATHGVKLRVEWSMTGFDELAMWRFTVKAFRGLGEPDELPFDTKSLVWPTASHKTVLGALLWLLMTIDDDLTASEALRDIR